MTEHYGQIWWSELVADDVDAAKDYYSKICGWTFETLDMPDGPYHIAHLGETVVAGLMAPTDEMTDGPRWTTYVAVDDVDEAAKASPKVHAGPFDIPGVGRIAIVTGGGGALVGLITPASE